MTIIQAMKSTNFNTWQDYVRTLTDEELEDMPTHLHRGNAISDATIDELIRRDLEKEGLM